MKTWIIDFSGGEIYLGSVDYDSGTAYNVAVVADTKEEALGKFISMLELNERDYYEKDDNNWYEVIK